jgi:hypothetical protein
MTMPTTPPTTATPGMSVHGTGAARASWSSMLDTVPLEPGVVQRTRHNTGTAGSSRVCANE